METKQLQLVTFEQAKRLKELGFDLETMDLYHNDGNANVWIFKNHNAVSGLVSAPSVAFALKWFRDEKKIIGFPYYDADDYTYYFNRNGVCCDLYGFETYEAAESALLDELLTILEKEKEQ